MFFVFPSQKCIGQDKIWLETQFYQGKCIYFKSETESLNVCKIMPCTAKIQNIPHSENKFNIMQGKKTWQKP